MTAVVLSAAPRDHVSLRQVADRVAASLARAGHTEVREIELAGNRLGYCQGEFDCWVRTPGRCKIEDGQHAIVAAIHDAEVVVLLGPVVFGGHDPDLKRALDRTICLLNPFFEKRASLTHHGARYAHPPKLFAVGWLEKYDREEIQTWHSLLDANALNVGAPLSGSAVLVEAERVAWAETLDSMFACATTPGIEIEDRESLRAELMYFAESEPAPPAPLVRRAAILIGSAKPKGTSASEALACGLAAGLDEEKVELDWHHATAFTRESTSAIAAARAIAEADLFVLAAPLYFDAFPSLVMRALQLVARVRRDDGRLARFVPIVNCGFPEPEHIRTALRIARNFSRRAGWIYGGALPLGGGGAIVGRALDDPHGPAIHVSRALALAAPALALGGSVPHVALAAMLERPIPDAFYRVAGDLGFRWLAHGLGVPQSELKARPLDREP